MVTKHGSVREEAEFPCVYERDVQRNRACLIDHGVPHPDETMEGLSQKPPETLQTSFALSPGTYLVRLVVRSAADQAMTEMSSQVDVR